MAGAGFPRQVRLLNAAQFKAVFDDAPFRASCKEILALARPNGLWHARLGIVIAKKNCRHATQRNRAKRLIRESFRQQHAALEGLDIIVLARRGIADLDNGTITQHLDRLWNRLSKTSRAAASTGFAESPPP
jgi:ribonuclease P protein component